MTGTRDRQRAILQASQPEISSSTAMSSAAATPQTPGPPSGLIRVALVEDDPVQRAEISRLSATETRLRLVGTWAAAEDAAAALPSLAPAVVLVDIGLPGQSGIELVNALKPRLPATQFMMLTVVQDAERIFSALAAGATGYLLKKDAPLYLAEAVRELHAGGSPMSGAIARHVVQWFQPHLAPTPSSTDRAAPPPPRLSPREQEILDLLAQGRLYKEIAEVLGIAVGTVRTHVYRIDEKLHARNRMEAVRQNAAGRRPSPLVHHGS